MTEQEAIESLKAERDLKLIHAKSEALDMAISALERQIPKKVKVESWIPAKCPSCGEYIGEWLADGYVRNWTNTDMCPHCKQYLDWSEEE